MENVPINSASNYAAEAIAPSAISQPHFNMKAVRVAALCWLMLLSLSVTVQAASLQTPENTPLSVPAAGIAAGGIPGSTNLSGSKFQMSAVVPATLRGGKVSLINSQAWARRFTNSASSLQSSSAAVVVRSDGNVVTTGVSYDPTNHYNFLTMCYSPEGLPLWTNLYDGPARGDDTAELLATGTNCAVWVAGESARFATNGLITDSVLVCYASNGLALWTNRYSSNETNSDYPTRLVVDNSGNAYLGVSSVYWPPSGSGVTMGDAIIKYDPLGIPIWTNAYAADAPDSGHLPRHVEAMTLNAAGDLFIAGMTGFEHELTGSAVAKMTGDGAMLWTNFQPFGSLILFRSLIIDPHGDVIVTAENSFSNGGVPYVLTKCSGTNGNPLWTNIMAGPAYDGGDVPQTVVTPLGDVLLVGGRTAATSVGLYQVMGFDSNGVPLWTNLNVNFGTNNSELYGVAVDNAGGCYLAGNSPDPLGGSADFITIRLAGSGQPLWTNRYDGPAGLDDYAVAIAVNGYGEVYVSGESESTNGFEFTTVKYADAVNYLPPTNFAGLDMISYTLTDSAGASADGSVPVAVIANQLQFIPVGTGPATGGFQVTVGTPGTNTVIIEASPDLVNWLPIDTNTPSQGMIQFLDTSSIGMARRFYRAGQAP